MRVKVKWVQEERAIINVTDYKVSYIKDIDRRLKMSAGYPWGMSLRGIENQKWKGKSEVSKLVGQGVKGG